LLGRLASADEITQIIEHLQRDAEVLTELIENRQNIFRCSRNGAAQSAREAHQCAGLQFHRCQANWGNAVLGQAADRGTQIHRLPKVGAQQSSMTMLIKIKNLIDR
jgi:hypothetical protein